MNFLYNRRSLPPLQGSRIQNLLDAASRFRKKISELNVERVALSDHGREHVSRFQSQADDAIRKYVHILAWLQFPEYSAAPDVLIDYGAGHGLLGCLAKEAGFPRVIYNDVSEGSARDARLVADELRLPGDLYVCGDIHQVAAAVKCDRPKWLTLASVNVIEHIYDLDDFISTACSLSNGPMTMALSTSANMLNPLVVRRHRRQHREWEFTDGPHKDSQPMDTPKAFQSVRRDIIKVAAPSLSPSEVDSLTNATRGMRKSDIEKCVLAYLHASTMPALPKDPTNTCDPLTGSWQERLLEINEVQQPFGTRGFTVRFMGGYYSGHGSGSLVRILSRIVAYGVNWGISLLGSQGTPIAPCIMFHATRP